MDGLASREHVTAWFRFEPDAAGRRFEEHSVTVVGKVAVCAIRGLDEQFPGVVRVAQSDQSVEQVEDAVPKSRDGSAGIIEHVETAL